jgi:methionyl aminopeptidase
MVELKSLKEIEGIRESCKMAAETLLLVGEKLRAGMTTDEIDKIVHEDTIRRGAYPSPLNYKGFPKSVCTSINDVVCHGIPGGEVLKNGDIVNVDVTTFFKGFHGDTSARSSSARPRPRPSNCVETPQSARP